jgi:hypothetical protein
VKQCAQGCPQGKSKIHSEHVTALCGARRPCPSSRACSDANPRGRRLQRGECPRGSSLRGRYLAVRSEQALAPTWLTITITISRRARGCDLRVCHLGEQNLDTNRRPTEPARVPRRAQDEHGRGRARCRGHSSPANCGDIEHIGSSLDEMQFEFVKPVTGQTAWSASAPPADCRQTTPEATASASTAVRVSVNLKSSRVESTWSRRYWFYEDSPG